MGPGLPLAFAASPPRLLYSHLVLHMSPAASHALHLLSLAMQGCLGKGRQKQFCNATASKNSCEEAEASILNTCW